MAWTALTFIVNQILTSDAMNDLQANVVSVRTSEFGVTPPAGPATGTEWWDSGASIWYKKMWDGSQWVRMLYVDSAAHEGGVQAQNNPWGSIPMVDATQDRTDFAGTPYFPKNMLLNGRMRFWQRGNSHSVVGASLMGPDRWWLRNSTAAAKFTVIQTSRAPASTRLDHSMEITVDSSQTVGSHFISVEQIIEGTVLRRTGFGQDITPQYTRFSFWAWAGVTGRLSVYLTNGSRSVTFNDAVDITVASTWQFKQVGFLQPTSGDWHFGVDAGARLGIVLACGSSWHTRTPDAWLYNSPDVRASSGQLNGISAVGTIFRFTGLQYEIGQMATPFEMLPEAVELTLLQRYFYKTFDIDERPRPNSQLWAGAIMSVCDVTGHPSGQVRLPSPMRDISAATAATYCPWANSFRWWRNVPASVGENGIINLAYATEQCVLVQASPSVTYAHEGQSIHMSIDCELF